MGNAPGDGKWLDTLPPPPVRLLLVLLLDEDGGMRL